MKKSRAKVGKVTPKRSNRSQGEEKLSLSWLMEDLVSEVAGEIEAFSARIGLHIMQAVMEHEVSEKVGVWGQQKAYRHGAQPGYVVYGGRKVKIKRPRVRGKDGAEVNLETYRGFQGEGKMQAAVARQLTRRCSARDYSGAIDECLEGYGISRSSVSRQWKAATQKQLQKLCQRPIAEGLVALLLDGIQVKGDCIVVALGVTADGKKQVLGLWHGATENSTVVKGLLEDLIERGLDPGQPLLFVIDGSKALRKAIREVFGSDALVQRCRVHKQRNIVQCLPKDKQQQAIWRLRDAWNQSDPQKAREELKKVVKWLEKISPSAARSLQEALEETLTLQKLRINGLLLKSLSSTNLIESCFSRSREWCSRVKKWRSPQMLLRWTAAGLLDAEKRFHRIHGYRHLEKLASALQENMKSNHKKAA